MLKFASAAVASLALLAMPALADGLVAEQSVERIVTTTAEDGTIQTEYVAADTVIPGEQLVYGLSYTNGGTEAADNVILTVPVPEAVSYIENSATTQNASVAFSIDGGESFSPRGDLRVSVDGEERAALADEITHVRWTFKEPIPPAATGKLIFKAVLN